MGFKSLSSVFLGTVLLATLVSSLILVREGTMYVSPDETANSVFSLLYAEEGRLALREPLNIPLRDALHPRSVMAREGLLVPSGFLGIPLLFGTIGKIFGTWTIPLATSILALFGACAWWGIVRRLYDRETAFLATFFLAVHPAWWYYTARALMPNVPFVVCVLLAIWWGMAKPIQTFLPRMVARWKYADMFFSGIFFGAALLIRPAELPWMILAAILYIVVARPRLDKRSCAWFAGAVFLTLLPLLPLNTSLYGSPFTTGYTATSPLATQEESVQEELLPPAPGSEAPEWWRTVQRVASPVFPFGIHPRNALRATVNYGAGLFWWMTILAVIGLFFVVPGRSVSREVRARRRAFLVVGSFVSVWLFILYGSWTIHDNPDPTAVSIANSYVRYWLPIFLLTTVPAALAVRALQRRLSSGVISWVTLTLLLGVCVALSVRATFFAPHDGLVSVARTLTISREIKERLLEHTEPNAVVVVDRADKLFFPERRVRYPLRDERTYALLPRIVLLAPLYYYGITFPEKDLAYLNGEKLKGLGLRIDLIETYNEESLYRITPAPSNLSPL